ncbi:proton-conducting transporter membrane subunit [Streptomyces sp. M19]
MYAVVNLGAFAVAALVARTSAANRLTDYRGLYARRPLAALSSASSCSASPGSPGVIGLFAKVTVFSAAVDAGLGWLAAVMAVNVVIALFYYLRWTALLFHAPEPAPESVSESAPAVSGAAHAPPTRACPRPHHRHRSRRRPRSRALRSPAARPPLRLRRPPGPRA